MFKKVFNILTSFGLLIPATAFCDFKVAYLDVAKVLNESKEAKSQRASLDAKSKSTREKLEARRNELKTLEKSIREKGVGENSKEVEQWKTQAKAFDGMVREAEDEIRKEYLKINRALSEKTLKLVSDYAKANDLDLVLDKGEAGRGPVLFGQESLDITKDILNQVEK